MSFLTYPQLGNYHPDQHLECFHFTWKVPLRTFLRPNKRPYKNTKTRALSHWKLDNSSFLKVFVYSWLPRVLVVQVGSLLWHLGFSSYGQGLSGPREHGVLVLQFSSVAQSCPTLWIPWTAAHQASLSITNRQSPPKSMSIESVMPSNHLILCHPLLLLPSIFPSIRVFSNESAVCIRWPKNSSKC